MKQFVKIVTVFLLLFFFSPSHVLATAQISVSSLPLTIDQSTEFQADVTFSCPGCGDSYLRGVFYPSGSSYFGFTQDNGGNWSNAPGGSCATFFKIAQIDLSPDGTWSGKLKFKLDKDSSYYAGPGEYSFKIGRYTPSCSSPSVWSTESTISITGPAPTPTSTPILISSPTLIPTKIPTSTIIIPVTAGASSGSSFDSLDVLGNSTQSGENITPIYYASPTPITSVLGKDNSYGIIMSIGLILFSVFGIIVFRKYRKYKNEITDIE